MVSHIGRIDRGDRFSKEDAAAVIGAAVFTGPVGVGAGVAMEGMTFLGPLGRLFRGGIAAGVVKSSGEAIIAYFEKIDHHEIIRPRPSLTGRIGAGPSKRA